MADRPFFFDKRFIYEASLFFFNGQQYLGLHPSSPGFQAVLKPLRSILPHSLPVVQ
jgi:hypothetical protein